MARKIFFNVQTGELVQNTGSPSLISTPIVLFVGDTVDLEFYPLEPSTADPLIPWVTYSFPVGATFKFGVKKITAFAAPTYYAFQDTFTSASIGGFSGKACTLSLNTAALIAEVATDEESDSFVMELEMNVAGASTTLVQWQQAIKNQVNIGSEGAVTPASPTYPTVTEMQAYVRGGNNSSQFFKRVTCATGSLTGSVTFDATLSSATFNVEWSYENTTDADPDTLGPPIFTAKSTTALSWKLPGAPSTGNTKLVLKGNLDPT